MKKIIMTGWIMDLKPRVDNWNGGFATIVIPDLGDRQLAARDTDGPLYIETGDEEPMFTRDISDRKPLKTDEVVVELCGTGDSAKILRWAFSDSWKKAQAEIFAENVRRQAEIDRMPVYRVTRENRFKGQIMSGAARPTGDSAHKEVVFTGRLDQLVAECPRDGLRVSAIDKFAPTYKVGPITAKNLFEVKVGDSEWQICNDPRPFPIGPEYRVMHRTEKGSKRIVCGTALEINFSFPRGERDPLARREAQGGVGSSIYWECKCASNKNDPEQADKEFIWVQAADPRPLPPVLALPKAETRPKASVAMPKKTKPQAFSTTLRGLEELALA